MKWNTELSSPTIDPVLTLQLEHLDIGANQTIVILSLSLFSLSLFSLSFFLSSISSLSSLSLYLWYLYTDWKAFDDFKVWDWYYVSLI